MSIYMIPLKDDFGKSKLVLIKYIIITADKSSNVSIFQHICKVAKMVIIGTTVITQRIWQFGRSLWFWCV